MTDKRYVCDECASTVPFEYASVTDEGTLCNVCHHNKLVGRDEYECFITMKTYKWNEHPGWFCWEFDCWISPQGIGQVAERCDASDSECPDTEALLIYAEWKRAITTNQRWDTDDYPKVGPLHPKGRGERQ